jgi:hypothetical protein
MDLANELAERLREPVPDLAEISARLDRAAHAERVAATRALSRDEQRTLYRAADGFRSVRLADLVPPGIADGVTVRHHGTNTLPAFTRFEKRICRPLGEDRAKPAALFGFNYLPWVARVAPGYFVAVDDPSRPEVRIDYHRVPNDRPDGWPRVRSNERIPGRFIYGFMVDALRGVSEHVTVGAAARHGRDLDSYFVLVREDEG